jgi:hypothetical protein
MKKFRIIASKAVPNQPGSYYTKLGIIQSDDIFGDFVMETYNVKSGKLMSVGTELELDMTKYEVKAYETSWKDEKSGLMNTATIKWIKPKTA